MKNKIIRIIKDDKSGDGSVFLGPYSRLSSPRKRGTDKAAVTKSVTVTLTQEKTMAVKARDIAQREIMELLKAHKDVLRKYYVKRIGLFGSYVRGNPRKDSDIDFLVEFKKPTFDNFMDLAYFLELELGKKVDLITKNSLSPYLKPYVDKEVAWYEA